MLQPGWRNRRAGNRHTFSYRLDVLRFFDIDTEPTSPTFGHTIVNGLHSVELPDSGPNGNQPPLALGASLFIVFRYPEGHPQANVLNSIVVYDDGLSLNNSQPVFTQPMGGFYQPATQHNAKISYIVGSGQAAKGERIVLPGQVRWRAQPSSTPSAVQTDRAGTLVRILFRPLRGWV